ncbi:MAG: hypothetical protein JNM94_05300 [Phycisphaerae bacterium]|nr:hypothetical protein [Phycisphaerae bacterium]
MHTLLAKDLRLAGDALRPALLILVGFVVGLALLSAVPESILPLAGSLSITDSLYGIPRFLLVASGPFALVATAMTLRGDRRHGATLLAGSLPVSAARQGASALVVLLVVTAALPLALFVLVGLRWTFLDGATEGHDLLSTPVMALLVSASGTAFALVASRPARSPWTTIAVSLLFVVAAAGLGVAIGAIVIVRDLGFDSLAGRDSRADSVWLLVIRSSALYATFGAALGGGLIGVLSLVGRESARFKWLLRAATIGLVVLTATFGIDRTLASGAPRDELGHYQFARAIRLAPAQLAQEVRALPSFGIETNWRLELKSPADKAVLDAARTYIRTRSPTELERDPVAAALRERESFGSASATSMSIRFLVPLSDPRRVTLALEYVCRFPGMHDPRVVAQQVLNDAYGRWPLSIPPDVTSDSLQTSIDATLRTALETLIREGHPESERMKAVLDVLPVDAAATQK